MNTDSPQVQQLKLRYRASFRDKAAELQRFASELSAISKRQAEHLAEARAFLHKLAGSAGMYGYQNIADLARGAMHDIDNGLNPQLIEKITRLCSLLKQRD